MLYRLFGDKNGLLAAVVDNAFARYMTLKRATPLSDDPVDQLEVLPVGRAIVCGGRQVQVGLCEFGRVVRQVQVKKQQ